jgi:hypothetical protein
MAVEYQSKEGKELQSCGMQLECLVTKVDIYDIMWFMLYICE